MIPMKGSVYTLEDLIPDGEIARRFRGGLCLVFRLQATDEHSFCCFDDATLAETRFLPGQLHSVQPIALRSIPVFRLNRRWYSVLETEHFGTAVQIEIGAMMVGGVSFAAKDRFSRGEEFGCFELAGSTIVLLLDSSVRNSLCLKDEYLASQGGETEVPVSMGKAIGTLS